MWLLVVLCPIDPALLHIFTLSHMPTFTRKVILNTPPQRTITGMSSLAPPVSTTKLKEGIRRALEAHEEITVAYLYGSTVKGIAGEESDIDVGLLLRDGFTCGALYPARIAGEIGRSIGLRRDVDVRVLNSQSTRFQYRVVKEGEVILCRDEDRRVAFETRAAAGYLDLKPFHEQYDEQRRRRLRA